MPDSETFRPFSNGTQFHAWMERNCDRCWKQQRNPEATTFRCAIESALQLGMMITGTVSRRIAQRMGFLGGEKDAHLLFTWDCPERQERRPCASTPRGRRPAKEQAALDV